MGIRLNSRDISWAIKTHFEMLKRLLNHTPPRNRGGVVFSLQFVSVCVCDGVCACLMFPCEQYSSRTDVPIWTRFSLNCCLPHWLKTLKLVTLSQSSRLRRRKTHFFFIILCYIPYRLSQLSYVRSKWNSRCRWDTLGRFFLKFHENRMDDDVI